MMGDRVPKIRTVVVDDEPMALELLRSFSERDDELEVVAVCSDGSMAVEAVRTQQPDLLILDVHMPGINGLEVLEELRHEEVPLVIFATAHDHHAVRAFELHAVDYLLKPFDGRRFEAAVTRAKERLRGKSAERAKDDLLELVASVRESRSEGAQPEVVGARPLQRLSVHTGSRVDYISTDDVEWIEAANQYVNIHVGETTYLMRGSLAQLERDLDPTKFVRIHRSSIVALTQVRSLDTVGDGSARVILGNGECLPVGRTRLTTLRERLK